MLRLPIVAGMERDRNVDEEVKWCVGDYYDDDDSKDEMRRRTWQLCAVKKKKMKRIFE